MAFAIADRVKPDRLTRVVLVLGEDGTKITARRSNAALEDVVLACDSAGGLPASLAAFWPEDRPRRLNVEVALSAEKVLVRHLTLPAVSDRDLGKILELRMDRELPLARDRVGVDWTIAKRNKQSDKVVVAIGIVRRRVIDDALASIEGWGWKPMRIGLLCDDDKLQFDFLTPRHDSRSIVTNHWHWPLAKTAGVLATAILVVLGSQWSYERTHVASALGQARLQLKEQAHQHAQFIKLSESAVSLHKLMTTPAADQLLADLTALLPMDTWVSDLEIQSGAGSETTIRLIGYTPTATELVNLIEASKRFGNVELVSATSAGLGSASDRVELSAKWLPSPPAPIAAAGT